MEIGVKRVIREKDINALFDFYTDRHVAVLQSDKFRKWVENQRLYFETKKETERGRKVRKDGYIVQEVFKRSTGQDKPDSPRAVGALIVKMAEYKTPEIKGFIIDDSVRIQSDIDKCLNALIRDVEDLLRKEGYDSYLVFANTVNKTAASLFTSAHFHVERVGGKPESGKQEFVFRRNVSPCYMGDPFNWIDKVLWYIKYFIGMELPDLRYRTGKRIEKFTTPIAVQTVIYPRTDSYCEETQKIDAGFIIYEKHSNQLEELLQTQEFESTKLVFVFSRTKEESAARNVIWISEKEIDQIIKTTWERINAKAVGWKNGIYEILHPPFSPEQIKGIIVDLTKSNFDKLLDKYISDDFTGDHLLFYISAPVGEYAPKESTIFFYTWDYDEIGAYGAIIGKGEILEVINVPLDDHMVWEEGDEKRSSFSTKEELSKHLAKQILKIKFKNLEYTPNSGNYFTFQNIIDELYGIEMVEWDEMLDFFRPEDVGHMYITQEQVQIINKKLRTEKFAIPNNGNFDKMLNIHNKGALEAFGPYIFRTSIRRGLGFSLVFFDIDNFKKINESNTHSGGDEVLRSVVNKIKESCLEKGSHLFRYGGEEFVVLLPGASKQRGVEKAEEIRKTVESLETNYNGTLIKCTLSLGVCCVKGGDNISWGNLLSSAQKAEKKAKEQGRNMVVCT